MCRLSCHSPTTRPTLRCKPRYKTLYAQQQEPMTLIRVSSPLVTARTQPHPQVAVIFLLGQGRNPAIPLTCPSVTLTVRTIASPSLMARPLSPEFLGL